MMDDVAVTHVQHIKKNTWIRHQIDFDAYHLKVRPVIKRCVVGGSFFLKLMFPRNSLTVSTPSRSFRNVLVQEFVPFFQTCSQMNRNNLFVTRN